MVDQTIRDYKDVWFNSKKDYGMVTVEHYSHTDKQDTEFHRFNAQYTNKTKNKLNLSKNRSDTYMSVNAFKSDGFKSRYSTIRNRANISQFRSVFVDVDMYKVPAYADKAPEERLLIARDFIDKLVDDNKMPLPNLVTYSQGIQLFWSIKDGASVTSKMTSAYLDIENHFVNLLAELGADHKCVDISRICRVPYSVNSKNNSIVRPVIWNDQPYTFSQLVSYPNAYNKQKHQDALKSGEKDKPAKKESRFKVRAVIKTITTLRLQDLYRLFVELRNGNNEGYRDEALYTYAYYFELRNQFETIDELHTKLGTFIEQAVCDLPKDEVYSIVKSAFNGAINYLKWCEKQREEGKPTTIIADNYRNDGIVRPRKNKKIIKLFDITPEEQLLLRNIKTPQEHKKVEEKSRREQGIKSRKEVALDKAQPKVEFIKAVIDRMPKKTQKWIASKLNLSKGQISKYCKRINKTDEFDKIQAMSMVELVKLLRSLLKMDKKHLLNTGIISHWNDTDFKIAFIMLELISRFSLNDYLINLDKQNDIRSWFGSSIGKLKYLFNLGKLAENDYRNQLYALKNEYQDKLKSLPC